MKKKIVIGSILAIIVLMMVPSISAIQYISAVEKNTTQTIEQIKKIDIDELKEKLKTIFGGFFATILYLLTYWLVVQGGFLCEILMGIYYYGLIGFFIYGIVM